MLVLASDQSCGEIRSCSGPSTRRMKAADTWRGPACTNTRPERMLTPSGSDVCIQRLTSRSAAPSPSTEISSSSGSPSRVCRALRPFPTSAPVVSWWKETRKA